MVSSLHTGKNRSNSRQPSAADTSYSLKGRRAIRHCDQQIPYDQEGYRLAKVLKEVLLQSGAGGILNLIEKPVHNPVALISGVCEGLFRDHHIRVRPPESEHPAVTISHLSNP